MGGVRAGERGEVVQGVEGLAHIPHGDGAVTGGGLRRGGEGEMQEKAGDARVKAEMAGSTTTTRGPSTNMTSSLLSRVATGIWTALTAMRCVLVGCTAMSWTGARRRREVQCSGWEADGL